MTTFSGPSGGTGAEHSVGNVATPRFASFDNSTEPAVFQPAIAQVKQQLLRQHDSSTGAVPARPRPRAPGEPRQSALGRRCTSGRIATLAEPQAELGDVLFAGS